MYKILAAPVKLAIDLQISESSYILVCLMQFYGQSQLMTLFFPCSKWVCPYNGPCQQR